MGLKLVIVTLVLTELAVIGWLESRPVVPSVVIPTVVPMDLFPVRVDQQLAQARRYGVIGGSPHQGCVPCHAVVRP